MKLHRNPAKWPHASLFYTRVWAASLKQSSRILFVRSNTRRWFFFIFGSIEWKKYIITSHRGAICPTLYRVNCLHFDKSFSPFILFNNSDLNNPFIKRLRLLNNKKFSFFIRFFLLEYFDGKIKKNKWNVIARLHLEQNQRLVYSRYEIHNAFQTDGSLTTNNQQQVHWQKVNLVDRAPNLCFSVKSTSRCVGQILMKSHRTKTKLWTKINFSIEEKSIPNWRKQMTEKLIQSGTILLFFWIAIG